MGFCDCNWLFLLFLDSCNISFFNFNCSENFDSNEKKKGGLCQRGVGAQSTAPVIDINVDLKYANRSAQQPYPRTRDNNSLTDQRLVSISHFAVEK